MNAPKLVTHQAMEWSGTAHVVGIADAEAYARAMVAAERERCAKLCETLEHGAFGPSAYLNGVRDGSIGCANAIRSSVSYSAREDADSPG